MRRRGSLPWKKALLESRWAGRGPGKKSREPRTLRFEPLEVRMLLSVTITANKPNATLQPLANGEFTVTESVRRKLLRDDQLPALGHGHLRDRFHGPGPQRIVQFE